MHATIFGSREVNVDAILARAIDENCASGE